MKSSMMSSKVRSSQGCWTCRLRRKKCDETRPVCIGCSSLEITCHFEDEKPDWMDGGAHQKEMADQLKRQVKVQANHRRERKYLQSFELAASAPDVDDTGSDSEQVSAPSSAYASSSRHATSTSPATSHETPPDSSAFMLDTVKSSIADIAPPPTSASTSTSTSHAPATTSGQAPGADVAIPSVDDDEDHEMMPPDWLLHMDGPTITSPVLEDEADMNFVMVYFDHVFPFLFPFYRPSLIEGGRGWLLSLLRSNKAVYHTALSLSSYFFTVVLKSAEGEEGPCQMRNRQLLQEQQELSLRELQTDMAAINSRGVHGHLRESIRVLNSIIQLLVFDVAVANSTLWNIHVDAAVSLILQIVPEPGLWRERVFQMGFPARSGIMPPPGFTIPWTTEQAALRIFGASLFLIDVLAATASEQRPRLQDYHATAFDLEHTRDPNADNRSLIRMEDLFGVQTWIIHLVGEIAALDAWKKEQKRAGTLSVTQLVARAEYIQTAIRQGLACLNGLCSQFSPGSTAPMPHPIHTKTKAPPTTEVYAWYEKVNTIDPESVIPVHTKIWAFAALSYLFVVVNGWQPGNPEAACPAAAAVELFDQLQSAVCTRQIAWPFCVVGCLAQPSQRHRFAEIVDKMGPLGVFGSIRTSLAVMETVWAREDSLDETWDIAACLQSLGHPVLLI